MFLTEALAPATFRRTGQARFECDVISFDDLATKPLDDYAAVCLLDPPPLADAVWQSLATYVDRGGGLAIWLGRNAQPQGAVGRRIQHAGGAESDAGQIGAQFGIGKMRFWRRKIISIRCWRNFAASPAACRGMRSPSGRTGSLRDLADGVNTVIPYSNGQPALLERSVGKGRVLVFTTPISDEATDPDLWNLLAVGSEPWPFVMLSNEMMLYLVGSGEERLNY